MIRPSFNGSKVNETQLRAYEDALAESHFVGVRVQLLDANEQVQSELASGPTGVLGGQVDIDVTSDGADRTLSLSILDPSRKITLDETPSDYGLFVGSFVRVYREDYVAELGGFVSYPVFTGPVSSFARDHPEVALTARGKEALALDPYVMLSALSITRGTLVTTAIKRIMGTSGERRYQFPELHTRLGHHLSVPRLSQAWRASQKLAGTANRQLFYDGAGYLRLRRRLDDAVFTFRDGDRSMLLQAPALAYDFTEFRNTADVTGGVPKKHKQKVHELVTVAAGNPLSPGALKRNGVPMHATTVIDDEQILRRAGAIERGRAAVSAGLMLQTDPSQSAFDALPVPHLEPGDVVRVATDHGYTLIRMRQWTIPLTSESMPVGIRRTLKWRTRYRHTRRGRRR
jgi:hypothetical protein